MNETLIKQTRLDELDRCQDRTWLSPEEEKRFRVSNPVDALKALRVERECSWWN